MGQTARTVSRHPVPIVAMLLLWIAAWVVTVVTWERDAAGHSIGMAPIAIALHLVLPLALGALVAHPDCASVGRQLKIAALLGLMFGGLEFLVLVPVDLFWLPSLETAPHFREQLFGALAGALVYSLICLVLSTLGAASRTALTLFMHGGKSGGPPGAAASRH